MGKDEVMSRIMFVLDVLNNDERKELLAYMWEYYTEQIINSSMAAVKGTFKANME